MCDDGWTVWPKEEPPESPPDGVVQIGPDTVLPALNTLVWVPTSHHGGGWSRRELAVIREIAYAHHGSTTIEQLREIYRDCRVIAEREDHPAFPGLERRRHRSLTDDELWREHEQAQKKRWIDVVFVDPTTLRPAITLGGQRRDGIFSSYIIADMDEVASMVMI